MKGSNSTIRKIALWASLALSKIVDSAAGPGKKINFIEDLNKNIEWLNFNQLSY
jgi:hypothetical protein